MIGYRPAPVARETSKMGSRQRHASLYSRPSELGALYEGICQDTDYSRQRHRGDVEINPSMPHMPNEKETGDENGGIRLPELRARADSKEKSGESE
jgi:hypothetical protein